MATSIETDLLEEFQLFFYNGDGLELLHTSLVLISLHSMRKSNQNKCRVTSHKRSRKTMTEEQTELFKQLDKSVHAAISKLPHYGIRFVLPSGSSFDFKFESKATSDSSAVVENFKSHVTAAFRGQIKKWSEWLVRQHTTCEVDAAAAGALLSMGMTKSILRFYMETDLSQEATKRVLLEALQHMTARLSGGIIPRNMARCIPSSKPGLDAVDKLLSSALATLGLQYEAQHYRVAPVSSEDQAEGNADADDASRLAGLKQVTVLPLASDTLPFKDETAKRKPARTSNTRSKVAKRAPEVSEVGAGLPAPLLSELEGPYPAELSDLFVSFSESHQEQGWASLELSTQLNAAETTPAMGMGNNAHFLINDQLSNSTWTTESALGLPDMLSHYSLESLDEEVVTLARLPGPQLRSHSKLSLSSATNNIHSMSLSQCQPELRLLASPASSLTDEIDQLVDALKVDSIQAARSTSCSRASSPLDSILRASLQTEQLQQLQLSAATVCWFCKSGNQLSENQALRALGIYYLDTCTCSFGAGRKHDAHSRG